jgi:hypothetical protein
MIESAPVSSSSALDVNGRGSELPSEIDYQHLPERVKRAIRH